MDSETKAALSRSVSDSTTINMPPSETKSARLFRSVSAPLSARDHNWIKSRDEKIEKERREAGEAEIAAEEHTEIVKAAIRKKYPRVKKIIKLKVEGVANKGIIVYVLEIN